MPDKKYIFDFTADEIMLLLCALNSAHKPIEYIGQMELAESLKRRFQNRIDKIFGISAEFVPKK